MSRRSASHGTRSPERASDRRADGLTRFLVRFQDWTAYRMEVSARDEAHAISIAQSMCTSDLWEAEPIDGGQEHFEAFPIRDAGEGA